MKFIIIFTFIISINCFGQVTELINSYDYVTFKKNKWTGKRDLSFSYSINIINNSISLKVNVIDQEVIFKESNTIVSDHIELWLFDPAIMNNIEEYKKQIKEVLPSRIGMFPHPATASSEKEKIKFQHDWDTNEKMIKLCSNSLNKINDFKYFNQYIFNKKEILISPEFKLNDKIQYSYKLTDDGYLFECTIPIYNSMTINSANLNKIGYLISISDIDHSFAKKQEKMMSSSDSAKYNHPETYNILECAINLELPDTLRLIDEINNGILFLAQKGYEFYSNKDTAMAGNYRSDGIRMPWGFEKTEIKRFYYDKHNSLGFNGFYLFCDIDKMRKIYNLRKYISSSKTISYDLFDFQKKSNAYYLLFSVYGYTNWPQSMGYCGAGYEEELVYVKLDRELNLLKVQTEVIHSCGLQVQLYNFDSTESKIELNCFEYRKPSKFTISYNKANPETGLKVIKKSDISEEEIEDIEDILE